MNDIEYTHLFGKARGVKRAGREAWSVLSTLEKLAVALILNQAEWLTSLNYTLAEAIGRVGPDWLALIPRIERDLNDVETSPA